MADEFTMVARKLQTATRPEDVFGRLSGSAAEQLRAARTIKRRQLQVVSPDRNGNSPQSNAALARLLELWAGAETAIKAGTYGRTPAAPKAPTVTISSKKETYEVRGTLASGDLAEIYLARSGRGRECLLKAARDAADNDLLQNEAEVLRLLRTPDKPAGAAFLPFLPELLESFRVQEHGGPPRLTNAFGRVDGLVPLTAVRRAYPQGIHPKDMAWMWRRLLHVLGYVHARGVVHGAVLPAHVMIHPEGHGVVLVDWCYAAWTARDRIAAISLDYEAWYPREVLKKEKPTAGTDILMAARCMIYLLGGDPASGRLPQSVPPPLRAFFAGCLLESPRQRPQDAWRLQGEFETLIERLWGPRKFRPFHLPT